MNMSVSDIFPDSTLRKAVRARQSALLARPTALSADFFSRSVREILDLPATVLKRQVLLLPGVGRKSAGILFEVINGLRKEFL